MQSRRVTGWLADPSSWEEFPEEIPDKLSKTAREEDFVLIYEDIGGKKILGFCSPTMLDMMLSSEIWFGDGMFSTVQHLMVSKIYHPHEDLHSSFFWIRGKKPTS